MKKNKEKTFTSLIDDLLSTLTFEQRKVLDFQFSEYLKRRHNNEKNDKKL